VIAISLIGGLGNQLFQYAIGRHLSIINQTDLRIDLTQFEKYKLHHYSLGHFSIKESFVSQKEMTNLYKVIEKSYFYDPDFKSIGNNVLLNGYWQSEKYFFEIAEIIRGDLIINSELSVRGLEISKLIQSSNSVSIHVRRSDYVVGTYTDQILDALDVSYYHNAIDMISELNKDAFFFIFSDDQKWVKNNLVIKNPAMYVSHNTAERNYEDLYLMSLCKHNIIANSSFSWWGAWLNNNKEKTVIAPKCWFNKNARNISDVDLIPSAWLRL